MRCSNNLNAFVSFHGLFAISWKLEHNWGRKLGQQTEGKRKPDPLKVKRFVVLYEVKAFHSHLQKSSSLKELQGLLDRVVQPMVASSGQIGPDQPHSNHQPPAEESQKCDLDRK